MGVVERGTSAVRLYGCQSFVAGLLCVSLSLHENQYSELDKGTSTIRTYTSTISAQFGYGVLQMQLLGFISLRKLYFVLE